VFKEIFKKLYGKNVHLLRGKKVILPQNDIKERAEKHETKLECNKGNYRKFVEMELEKDFFPGFRTG